MKKTFYIANKWAPFNLWRMILIWRVWQQMDEPSKDFMFWKLGCERERKSK